MELVTVIGLQENIAWVRQSRRTGSDHLPAMAGISSRTDCKQAKSDPESALGKSVLPKKRLRGRLPGALRPGFILHTEEVRHGFDVGIA